MVSLVLDENISPVVAEQTSFRRPDISIQSIFHWRGGALEKRPDHLILQAAKEDGLTLITYDLRTIPSLLMEWMAQGISHNGVIYVDERTIPSNDFGSLVRAIERFWEIEHLQDWTNRTDFLRRA